MTEDIQGDHLNMVVYNWFFAESFLCYDFILDEYEPDKLHRVVCPNFGHHALTYKI